MGIVLDLGGGPNHDRIGFRYWHDPGPFVQFDNIPGAKGRFLGWWAVMTQAAFSFIGTEVVAVRFFFKSSFLYLLTIKLIKPTIFPQQSTFNLPYSLIIPTLLDRWRRSQKPTKVHPQSYQTGIHPTTPILRRRGIHHRTYRSL